MEQLNGGTELTGKIISELIEGGSGVRYYFLPRICIITIILGDRSWHLHPRELQFEYSGLFYFKLWGGPRDVNGSDKSR